MCLEIKERTSALMRYNFMIVPHECRQCSNSGSFRDEKRDALHEATKGTEQHFHPPIETVSLQIHTKSPH